MPLLARGERFTASGGCCLPGEHPQCLPPYPLQTGTRASGVSLSQCGIQGPGVGRIVSPPDGRDAEEEPGCGQRPLVSARPGPAAQSPAAPGGILSPRKPRALQTRHPPAPGRTSIDSSLLPGCEFCGATPCNKLPGGARVLTPRAGR